MKGISSSCIFSLIYTNLILWGFITFCFQIVNGYFVHFFAPTNLQKLPKNIIFVIDISGSMSGREIEQVSYYITIESQWKSLCCNGRDMVTYSTYVLLKIYPVGLCCNLCNAHLLVWSITVEQNSTHLDSIYLLQNVLSSKLSIPAFPELCQVSGQFQI